MSHPAQGSLHCGAKEAFAAVNQRREILIATVSPTRRAAMVNWLVVEGGTAVYQWHSDQEIERMFFIGASQRGLALIEVVTVSLSSTGRSSPTSGD